MRSGAGRLSATCAAVALLALTGGCGHLRAMHWPWHHAPPPPLAPVHELDVNSPSGAADSFAQYWKRNTLIVDLSSVSGTGSITLKPAAGSAWPVRLAFRVRPGAIARLEVRADQRLSLPISGAGGAPIDLELTPRMYTSKTPQMTVSWGPLEPPPP